MVFRPRRINGFTLIELLVVITIIGLLIGLLLPAVNRVRESGRRTECMSNMRQVALAIKNYETSNRVYPAAQTSNKAHLWPALILYQLEQTALADTYQYDKNWNDSANQTAIKTVIPALLCPSSPTDGLIAYASGKQGAACDFAAPVEFQSYLVGQGLADKVDDRKGILRPNYYTPDAMIRDGHDTTILITEDAGRPEHWVKGGRGPENNTPACGNFPVSGGLVRGAGWYNPDANIPIHAFTFDGLQCPGDCAVNCSNNNEAFAFHTGGINTAFGGGNVSFVQEGITVRVWSQLITCNGHEVLESQDW
jgi:prepilin-type N-terminal cleavage/methylation domain-containing protein